jgi:ABC-type polysaccharide/polyol phosphate export permease
LTFWFFATPIIYWYKPLFELFPTYKPYYDANPFTHLAISYQEILFFDGGFGHWKWLLVLGGVSVVLFIAAYWFFDRLRDSFAEAV